MPAPVETTGPRDADRAVRRLPETLRRDADVHERAEMAQHGQDIVCAR